MQLRILTEFAAIIIFFVPLLRMARVLFGISEAENAFINTQVI